MQENIEYYERCFVCRKETKFEKTKKRGWCLCSACIQKITHSYRMNLVIQPPINKGAII